jgi:hypothetical protein
MKTLSKILFALIAVPAFSFGDPASANLAGQREFAVTAPLTQNRTSRLEYHDIWRKLWEDHITWTRVVILAILDDLPGAPAYTDRLLQNPQDMADALRPFYAEDANQLGELIREHLVIAAEILQAIHDGQPTEDLIARWYANADEIAAKMGEMNPQFWSFVEAQRMWREHLDATVAEILAHHNSNYTAEVAAYDPVHNLWRWLTSSVVGVMRQFPRNFKGHIQ